MRGGSRGLGLIYREDLENTLAAIVTATLEKEVTDRHGSKEVYSADLKK